MKERKQRGNFAFGALWSTRMISINVGVALIGYTTFFATNYLGLSIGAVGLVMLLSRMFDGISDLIAGYIIDRTKTKLGKGRPYELALIGYWVFGILIFATPAMGASAKLVYIFIMYNINTAVFSTLINVAEPVYLINSIKEHDKSVSILAIAGAISGFFVLIFNILLPQLIVHIATTQKGWIELSLILGIPFTLFGLLRFIKIHEINDVKSIKSSYSFIDGVKMLLKNKYLLILAGVLCLSNIYYTITCTNLAYYCTYVLGDLSTASLLTVSAITALLLVALSPIVVKKMGVTNFAKATFAIYTVSSFIKVFFPTNIPALFVSGLFTNLAPLPFWALGARYIFDCMDYGEWKTGIRVEGFYSGINGICGKLGGGLAAAIVGFLLAKAGFNGTLAVQSTAAKSMMIALHSYIPAIFSALILILLHFYDLEKMMPQIRSDLAKRKNEAAMLS